MEIVLPNQQYPMPLVSIDRTYEFEVAFSFLKEDESLAYEINDLIHDRYSTFVYGEHQKDLVGKDGTETFRAVFEEKARIVVVLFRESWGTTFWTRVEEGAIKRRSFEESPDFTIFISLDGNKPNWLSKTQVWYDFDRYGVKPTAAIIEKRISEYGGQIREETVLDQAVRHNRQIKRQRELEDYLLSKQGHADGLNEVERILNLAENNIDSINNNHIGLNFDKLKQYKESFTSFGRSVGLTFIWIKRYDDSLSGSYLKVFIADGAYYDNFPESQKIVHRIEKYVFYENESKTKGWVKMGDKSEFKTTEQLINAWQKDFLDREQKDLNKENNEHSRY